MPTKDIEISCLGLGLAFGLIFAGHAVAQPVGRDHRVQPPLRRGQLVMPADQTNAPDCSPADVSQLAEVMTKYQGLTGTNPSVPSTYNLIGKHKFSGSGWGFTNPFWGENWYPIRTEKQTLTGIFHSFGVANYGDESDWNIHMVPDPGFEDFVSEAIPYRADNWYASADWGVTEDGKITIEAEITPDERRYGNPWFTNSTGKSPLLKKRLTVYGPFVREEAHGNHPEIHPAEQIWWKDGNDVLMVLLVIDDSNRFKRGADRVTRGPDGRPLIIPGDYTARRATTPDHKPWVQEKGQEAELSLAFEVDPSKDLLKVEVQASDDLDFHSGASYQDPSDGDRHTISYQGKDVLSVLEEGAIDSFVGVAFRNVCANRAKGRLQGYVVLNTAIGNGSGKEGFVALRLKSTLVPIDSRPAIVVGDIANTWKVHAPYDDRVQVNEIISSDREGKGIVDGLVDFNGNGKTDLFAAKNGRWWVLYDGRGSWQEINTSSIAVGELRFGDIDGDRKTDVLRVGPGKKVLVSNAGTGQWTTVTDAGEQNQRIQVADFDGDRRTDIIYTKFQAAVGVIGGLPPSTGRVPARGAMYVKYGARGSWKKLNDYYFPGGMDEYASAIRFGHFNDDRISDVFRYDGSKFGVYWNGTGDFKELARPPASVRSADLLFVTGQTNVGLTDVVYVDPVSRKWTVFNGGRPGSLPLTIKHSDPSDVGFADLDADPVVEPFSIEQVQQRPAASDLQLVLAPRAVSDPVVMPRYLPGSLKRVDAGGRASLTASLDLVYYPGSGGTTRRRDELRNVTSVKERVRSRTLRFKAGPSPGAATRSDHGEVIGTIEDVPLSGTVENDVQIAFAARSEPQSHKLPAHGLTAVSDGINETLAGSGSWSKWKAFLSPNANRERTPLLAAGPASPSQVQTVSFELIPFYSSVERGKVRLVEMDAIATEMNDIAYGSDRARSSQIFGVGKAFTIEWEFELTNAVTGRKLPIANPSALASDGRWPKSKVTVRFPQDPDLLQLKATATIKDAFGNESVEPIEQVFWSERIGLTDPDGQLSTWLSPIVSGPAAGRSPLLRRARFLAEDGVLTPAEVRSLLR